MKKKLALFAAPIVLLAASAATAENRLGFTPYLGADAEFRHMDFQKRFGDNLISHNAPQGNVYAGVRLSEYFALEAGYEATKRKTRRSTLKTGDTVADFVIPGPGVNNTAAFNTTNQVKGVHGNLVGFLPVSDLYRLQLIGMVGIARLKIKSVSTLFSLNGNPLPLNQGAITFKARKNVLRLGVGLQHMIDCNWGVRGMLKWEASKKLKMNASNATVNVLNGSPFTLSVRPKNSVIYSVGAFYTF